MEKLTRGPIIGWHPPQQNCWGICSIPLSLLGASFHLNVRIKVYGAGPRTRSCWDGCRRGRSLPLDGSGITPRKFRKMYYMKFLGFSSRLIAKNAFTPIPHCFWCFALWRNCLPHVLPINGVQLLLASANDAPEVYAYDSKRSGSSSDETKRRNATIKRRESD